MLLDIENWLPILVLFDSSVLCLFTKKNPFECVHFWPTHITINQDDDWKIWEIPDDRKTTTSKPKTIFYPTQIPIQHIIEKSPFYLGRLKEHIAPYFYQYSPQEMFTSSNFYLLVLSASVIVVFSKSSGQDLALALFNRILEIISYFFSTLEKAL